MIYGGECVEERKGAGGHFVESFQTRKHVLSRVADSDSANHIMVIFLLFLILRQHPLIG